ncbi:hypothetical protein INT45_004295 [Circinella minor]|uniref:UspA domain-containing protein n=1 Tax=Circinella minor TaxID=1195481 RepID=A0A8H7SEZ1_9FUNG|nr:hypothetical protein INT45_004295 [Circinella minor]
MGENHHHRFTHKHRSHKERHKHSDDQPDSPQTPIVTITPSQENVTHEEKEGFKELNKVDERDKDIPKATIVNSEPDQNRLRTASMQDDDASTSSASSSEYESSSDERSSFSSQLDLLSEELKKHQVDLQMEDKEIDKKLLEDKEIDQKLLEATEYNRRVPSLDFSPTTIADNKTKTKNHLNKASQSSAAAPSTKSQRHLVFTEPEVDEQLDRIIVTQYYGKSSPEHKTHQKPRSYLVAYDFSKESRSAVEWTMGTILRDHDEIYVVTIVSEDDSSPESDKEPGQTLQDVSNTLNAKSKILLSHMLLFDIKLVTITARGSVREVLQDMMDELPLTMVVSGCRGRSTMKGMLMGSISTFLLHKSPVPVTVIRYQKKKKHKSKKKLSTHPHALSESIKTNHLVVDELGTTGASR